MQLFSNEIDRNAHSTSNRHFQSVIMIYSIIWFMVDFVRGIQVCACDAQNNGNVTLDHFLVEWRLLFQPIRSNVSRQMNFIG